MTERDMPTGDALPLIFICGVQNWQYQDNLWGGVRVLEDDKHGYIAAVLDVDMNWHEGWRGDTWAGAFAAIGAALDVSGTEILERELAETRNKLEALQLAIDDDQEARHETRHLKEHEAAIIKRLEADREGC